MRPKRSAGRRIQTIIREVVAQAIKACNRYVTAADSFPTRAGLCRALDAYYDMELHEVAKLLFVCMRLAIPSLAKFRPQF